MKLSKKKNEVQDFMQLSIRSEKVVENFNRQVAEIDVINEEVRKEIDAKNTQINTMIEERNQLEKLHDRNIKTQNSIKQLIS